MINNVDFAKRLQLVMEYYQLSAAAFADRIQVQRSSISHLLSGRNKPSLDFVMKVIKHFDEVELYWLLNGKGSFPKQAASHTSLGKTATTTLSKAQNIQDNVEIERIVMFFKDGTFKEYKP